MINYDDETLFQALQQFGFNRQVLVAVEELSELQKELLKNINREQNNRDHIKEELVDVLIILRELVLLYDFSEKELNTVATEKMERLKGYLNETNK